MLSIGDIPPCMRAPTFCLVVVRRLCYLVDMEVQSVRELAAVIRSLRREKGWSQAVLAMKAGVGREWIIHLEKARPTVELGLVMSTLRALGVCLSMVPQPDTVPLFDLNQLLGDAETPHES